MNRSMINKGRKLMILALILVLGLAAAGFATQSSYAEEKMQRDVVSTKMADRETQAQNAKGDAARAWVAESGASGGVGICDGTAQGYGPGDGSCDGSGKGASREMRTGQGHHGPQDGTGHGNGNCDGACPRTGASK